MISSSSDSEPSVGAGGVCPDAAVARRHGISAAAPHQPPKRGGSVGRERYAPLRVGGRRSPVRRQRQLVMVPAEQVCLEQDGEASKERDPAPRRATERLVHDFSATGAAVSIMRRRRQAWVAVTKLVTPTPKTVNTTSTNGRPSVSRLWMCSGAAISNSAAWGKASAKQPQRLKAAPPHA